MMLWSVLRRLPRNAQSRLYIALTSTIAAGRYSAIKAKAGAPRRWRTEFGETGLRFAPRDCHRARAKHARDQKANGDVIGNNHGTCPHYADDTAEIMTFILDICPQRRKIAPTASLSAVIMQIWRPRLLMQASRGGPP
jgi:hypothetical protein